MSLRTTPENAIERRGPNDSRNADHTRTADKKLHGCSCSSAISLPLTVMIVYSSSLLARSIDCPLASSSAWQCPPVTDKNLKFVVMLGTLFFALLLAQAMGQS